MVRTAVTRTDQRRTEGVPIFHDQCFSRKGAKPLLNHEGDVSSCNQRRQEGGRNMIKKMQEGDLDKAIADDERHKLSHFNKGFRRLQNATSDP